MYRTNKYEINQFEGRRTKLELERQEADPNESSFTVPVKQFAVAVSLLIAMVTWTESPASS